MKTYYRKGVKVDSDPRNDYRDGYNAAKRYYTKKIADWKARLEEQLEGLEDSLEWEQSEADSLRRVVQEYRRKEKLSHLVLAGLIGALLVFFAVILSGII